MKWHAGSSLSADVDAIEREVETCMPSQRPSTDAWIGRPRRTPSEPLPHAEGQCSIVSSSTLRINSSTVWGMAGAVCAAAVDGPCIQNHSRGCNTHLVMCLKLHAPQMHVYAVYTLTSSPCPVGITMVRQGT